MAQRPFAGTDPATDGVLRHDRSPLRRGSQAPEVFSADGLAAPVSCPVAFTARRTRSSRCLRHSGGRREFYAVTNLWRPRSEARRFGSGRNPTTITWNPPVLSSRGRLERDAAGRDVRARGRVHVSYMPPAGPVLQPGPTWRSPSRRPIRITRSREYGDAERDAAAPVITWNPPASIAYVGRALSGRELTRRRRAWHVAVRAHRRHGVLASARRPCRDLPRADRRTDTRPRTSSVTADRNTRRDDDNLWGGNEYPLQFTPGAGYAAWSSAATSWCELLRRLYSARQLQYLTRCVRIRKGGGYRTITTHHDQTCTWTSTATS